LALALSTLDLFGQSVQDIVSSYTRVITSFDCLYATYNFSIVGQEGNTKFAINGEFYNQGDRFLVKTYFSDIYCNGEYKAVHDKSVQEISFMDHNKGDMNMIENPFAVLKSGGEKYNLQESLKSAVYDGKDCWEVILLPMDDRADHTSVSIAVAKDDFSIKNISYRSKSGDTYNVLVYTTSECGMKNGTFFEPDLDSMPDVEVNDLR
jgi:hypothetical protein